MKKNILIILLLIVLNTVGVTVAIAQVKAMPKDIAYLNKVPREHTFVSFNNSLLFAGEYLYYTLYTFQRNDQRSNLSKIAYVELIDSQKRTIFKHKIRLKKGLGSGDFFLPANISTGSYKLLGYTQWMQNDAIDNFFQADVRIVNPYRASERMTKSDSGVKSDTSKILKWDKREMNNFNQLKFKVGKNFGNREKVSLKLSLEEKLDFRGNYTISVHKKNSISKPAHPAPKKIENYDSKSSRTSPVFLPEIRGELYHGMISSSNKPTTNLEVAISIPGDKYFFTIVRTNENGEFFFNIDTEYSGKEIIMEIVGDQISDYTIELIEHQSSNYDKINFDNFFLDRKYSDEIKSRSIRNQIENAYFKYKPDSTLTLEAESNFLNTKGITYYLDDYTRFKTIRETIFEIVKDVLIKKISKDENVIRIQGYNFNTNTGILPLVLLDGVMVQNYDLLLNFDANQIEKMTVYRDQFIIGTQVFQGALIVKSKEGILTDFISSTFKTSELNLKPVASKKYFQQRYDDLNSKNSKIPDQRHQLLWIPKLNITNNKIDIEFFTSDIDGEFEIVIEGFNENNVFHRAIQTFNVN